MACNLIKCVEEYIITDNTSYVIDEGKLRILPDTNKNIIVITDIFLKDEYQNKKILNKFLNYLSEQFDEIWFTMCNLKMSLILMTTCLKGRYFVNRYTGEHYWKKQMICIIKKNMKK
jgi:hypothetical protein